MIQKSMYCLLILSLVQGIDARKHPLNLNIAKDKVERYYECGRYDKDMDKVVHKAQKKLANIPVTDRTAVVFDIDDTVLSTYCEEKSISYGHSDKISQAFEKYGHLPAIPQTKRLYDTLVDRGFTIFFLTGRRQKEEAATIKNLHNQGFSTFEAVITRSPEENKLSASEFKSRHRAQLEQQGYHIVASVGDQWSDLCGGHAGLKVKLPNYRYLLP